MTNRIVTAQGGWSGNPLIHCRRSAIGFAQGLFAQLPDNDFKWSNDIKTTNIIITDANPVSAEQIGQRPVVNCVRAAIKFGSATLDDFQHSDHITGKRKHIDILSGNLVFNCCSENGYEAESIAWFLTSNMWILRRYLLRNNFHDVGRGLEITPVSPPGGVIAGDSDQTWRRVSIIVPFTFNWGAQITPLNVEVSKFVEIRMDAYAKHRDGSELVDTRNITIE